ncbi:MAG: hypothetical protein CSA21_04425 [Deltaproteobacteria bacterium]|nr:MAG: hypothetical protein CSA21_04425 [Deltaproteobacteria bacterium]
MEILIIVVILALLISVWGLGSLFISAKENILRHTTWHTQKKQDMDHKLQALKEQQALYLEELKRLAEER